MHPLAILGGLTALISLVKLADSESTSTEPSDLQSQLKAARDKLSEMEAESADAAKLRTEIGELSGRVKEQENELKAFKSAKGARRRIDKEKKPPDRKPVAEETPTPTGA